MWLTGLLVLVVVGTALDVPLTKTYGGLPVTEICANCTRVVKGVFQETNGTGDVVVSFNCSTSPAAQSFCQDPGLDVVASVRPDPVDICLNIQPKQKCIDSVVSPVTVWADLRLDPSYVGLPRLGLSEGQVSGILAGGARDMDPETYALFGHRSTYTPAAQAANGVGRPDLFGFGQGDPLAMQLGLLQAGIIQRADGVMPSAPKDHFHYEYALLESNNARLLMSFGATAPNPMTSAADCPGFGALGGHCTVDTYLRYLVAHSGVQTVRTRNLTRISITFSPPTAALTINVGSLLPNLLPGLGTIVPTVPPGLQALAANAIATNGCPAPLCFTNMTVANSRLSNAPPQTQSPFSPQRPFNLSEPLFATMAPNMTLPMTMGSNDYWLFTTDFAHPNGDPLTYPMFNVLGHNLGRMQDRGELVWMEESLDGATWTIHPQAFLSQVPAGLIERGAWRELAEHMVSSNATWRKSSRNVDSSEYMILYAPSGANKYMRMRHFKGTGEYGPAALASERSATWTFTVPLTVTYADRLEDVEVYVVPSRTPNGTEPLPLAAVCQTVPGCTVVAKGLPVRYPDDVHEGLVSGSTAMRAFYKSLARDLYKSCEIIVNDPVRSFLTVPRIKPRACHSFRQLGYPSTCYTYTTSTDADTYVRTDAKGLQITYNSQMFALTVTSEQLAPPYPVPVSIIGPFTKHKLTGGTYIYDVPVLGGQTMGSLWIAQSESCSVIGSTTLSDLPVDPTCECVDYPVAPGWCLCTSRTAWRPDGPPPPQITFAYPSFFTVRQFPTDFTVQARDVSFDTNLYTSVTVDCATFLCSGNADCFRRLQQSNYLAFCENQRRILATTLRALRGEVDTVDRATDDFMKLMAVTDLNAVTPLPESGLRPAAAPAPGQPATTTTYDQLANLTGPMKAYFAAVQEAKVTEVPSTTFPSGYNYREPYTKATVATGMSVAPWVGVGLLTEKVNYLATVQTGQEENLNNLKNYAAEVGNRVNILVPLVQDGFAAGAAIIAKLSGAHNGLVERINSNFANQGVFNADLSEAVNNLNGALAQSIASINFLDLISARAATLGIQTASIMVKAADHAERARIFAARVRACTSYRPPSAAVCAGSSTGLLLGTILKQTGTIATLSSLVLEPTAQRYSYSTPEFCSDGKHYTVTRPTSVFVLDQGMMYISTVSRWAPQPITATNARIVDGCNDPKITLVDISVAKSTALVLDESTKVLLTMDRVNVTLAPLLAASKAVVNITAELSVLTTVVGALQVFAVDPPSITLTSSEFSSYFGPPIALSTVAMIVTVVAAIIIIVLICKGVNRRRYVL